MMFDDKSGAVRVGLCVAGLLLLPAVAVPDALPASTAFAAEEAGEADPFQWQTDLAIWSLVSFLVFIWLLKRFAWKPLATGLDKRESRIRQDIADAEMARRRAERMLAEHAEKLDKVQDEVREIIAEARRDAETLKQEIIMQAQKEAETSRRRAVDDINRARDQALKDLFDQVATQVTHATGFILGRSVNGDDQNRLIEEALAEFSAQSSDSVDGRGY